MATRILKPQPGPQEKFLASSANIVVYGGSAGGGKTYGLLLSPLRYKNVPGFNCTIFRRNHTQIFAPGGLWDEAENMYRGIRGAGPRVSSSSWLFRNRDGRVISKVKFEHIDGDRDLYKWQGSQICGLCFDELTHFSEFQFFYMLSRNRSVCGVRPYVKATCNPDADSWGAKFIEWWIDQDSGYPIQERSGKRRWFIRRDETLFWADTPNELWEQFNLTTWEEQQEPRSVTFIMSSVYDNQELLKINPGYLSNLKSMSLIERERLLKGKTILDDVAGQMGVAVTCSYNAEFADIPNGYSFVGMAKDVLSVICKTSNLTWSIQNGVLQIKKPGDTMSQEVFVLSEETGLIGFPQEITVTADNDSKQDTEGWDVEFLMNAAINVDDFVYLKSKVVTGYFRVYSIAIDGDTEGSAWQCKARLLEVKG